MRKILSSFLFFILISNNVFANEKPHEYVQKVADGIFKIISNKSITLEQQKKQVVEQFENDIEWIWQARAVAGQNWKEMSEKQREDFTFGYKKYLLDSLLPKFKGYKNEKYEVMKKNYETFENGDALVPIIITTQNETKINLTIRVRKYDDKYKIINVIAEGIDLAVTNNSQFADHFQKYGINKVIEYLKTGKKFSTEKKEQKK